MGLRTFRRAALPARHLLGRRAGSEVRARRSPAALGQGCQRGSAPGAGARRGKGRGCHAHAHAVGAVPGPRRDQLFTGQGLQWLHSTLLRKRRERIYL